MNSRCQIVIPAGLPPPDCPKSCCTEPAGKTVLQHTYESALPSQRGGGVVVAVDDQRFADEVDSFGGRHGS